MFNPNRVERKFRLLAWICVVLGVIPLAALYGYRLYNIFDNPLPLIDGTDYGFWEVPEVKVCLDTALFPIPSDLGIRHDFPNVSTAHVAPVTIRYGADMQFCSKYMRVLYEKDIKRDRHMRGIYMVDAEVEYVFSIQPMQVRRVCLLRDQSRSRQTHFNDPRHCLSQWREMSFQLPDAEVAAGFEGCANAVVANVECSDSMIFSYDAQLRTCRCLDYKKTCDYGFGLPQNGIFHRLYYPRTICHGDTNTCTTEVRCPHGYIPLRGSDSTVTAQVHRDLRSIAECATLCNTQFRMCKSFQFSMRFKRCLLYSTSRPFSTAPWAHYQFCSRCSGTTCQVSWRTGLTADQVFNDTIEHLTTKCPWMKATLFDDILKCNDGTTCNASADKSGWACCQGKKGRLHCPPNWPAMCSGKCTHRDYCCQKIFSVEKGVDCGYSGGYRLCPESRVNLGPASMDLSITNLEPVSLQELGVEWSIPIKFSVGRVCWTSRIRQVETGSPCPDGSPVGHLQVSISGNGSCVKANFKSSAVRLSLDQELTMSVSYEVAEPGRLQTLLFQTWFLKPLGTSDDQFRSIIERSPCEDFLPSRGGTKDGSTAITGIRQEVEVHENVLWSSRSRRFETSFAAANRRVPRKSIDGSLNFTVAAEQYRGFSREYILQGVFRLTSREINQHTYLERSAQVAKATASLGGYITLVAGCLGFWFGFKKTKYHELTWIGSQPDAFGEYFLAVPQNYASDSEPEKSERGTEMVDTASSAPDKSVRSVSRATDD